MYMERSQQAFGGIKTIQKARIDKTARYSAIRDNMDGRRAGITELQGLVQFNDYIITKMIYCIQCK